VIFIDDDQMIDDLLRRPFGGRMPGAIEMNDSTPSMRLDLTLCML